ncbi:4-hydroxyphenylpyruvate dioxygenase [Rhodobium orientis]|uniref:3-dehydroshikimate dehydratase n=1 Tax=Rhodobium orientis TaxID=34017 RepID=A0A327JX20_9HYPH|nr:sugar phosphate isomerase/epimerase and 4-hydroxyphenylpyruvate domain-containing protein [Rhodobium orientis]MBB4303966.1 4-hydroxyphenylpyruvate dioxygenase [Rhodobium orientis]MBK5950822.1 3-keto-5-aminohexanoate cleavage protein [Rhodobium orientis]RAI29512.1 3-keto-5-aminohexanoate cleavage protein [Rhodobium orientis]
MKTSISTLSAADALEDKLAAFSAAGFDGIEISELDFAVQGRTPTEIGQMVRDQGLAIHLFQPSVEVEGLPEDLREKALNRIERRFDVMAELGTDLMLLGSATSAASLGGVDRMADDFALLGERAAARGLRVGYEARAWGRHVSDYRDAWEVIRRADRPAVGLVLDSFHVLARGLAPDGIRAIPADRIFHVQLADAPAVAMDLEYKSRRFRLLPGEGALPLLDFLSAVAATGYAGAYSLDLVENRSRATTRQLALDGHRALTALADAVRRAEPTCRFDLPDMPAKARIEGVEFIEFTAGADDAASLGEMLRQLGFTPVARHIARKVTLWQQNGINIVVNSETRGYAHSAYVMHGTSVCDIGLLVGDAEAAATRTEMLGARRFAQRRYSGELNIPAVRGVGGSVLHFLDRKTELGKVWETEFEPLPPDTSIQSTGLRRIDHLAQVMKQEELPSWILFYTSVFDVEKAPQVGVSDPSGLVRSRALQGADGAFRLTMNGVDTYRTFAGRFLSDSYGASVQHFAFLTDDIVASARKLAENHFESLSIPDSYYSDLGSDFDLAEDEIALLRELNILYDRDETGGSFLQLYSRPHGDGFFFEIVERRGTYNGYGARNAPYRTAALKRLAMPYGADHGSPRIGGREQA